MSRFLYCIPRSCTLDFPQKILILEEFQNFFPVWVPYTAGSKSKEFLKFLKSRGPRKKINAFLRGFNVEITMGKHGF